MTLRAVWTFLSLFFIFNIDLWAQQKLLDRVAIVVNKNVILASEINNNIKITKFIILQQGGELPNDAILYKQVCDRLIMKSIQLDLAKQMNLEINSDHIHEILAMQANDWHLSVEKLKHKMQLMGIDENIYLDQLSTEQLATEALKLYARSRITVSSEEVEYWLEQNSKQRQAEVQVKLQHILLALPEHPNSQQIEQVANLARQITLQLRKGADFARLSVTYSNAAEALTGGNMGWLMIDELPTAFAEKLKILNKGEIIEPFRSGAGYHILKVNDIKQPKHESAMEVHARQIFLKPSVLLSDVQVQKKLKRMALQISKKQKTFTELATQYSEDATSSAKGGDLGWRILEIFAPELRDALLTLKDNQLSEPIHTKLGWYLIERLGMREKDIDQDLQRKKAYRMILYRKSLEYAQNWLQEQRAAAYIKFLH